MANSFMPEVLSVLKRFGGKDGLSLTQIVVHITMQHSSVYWQALGQKQMFEQVAAALNDLQNDKRVVLIDKAAWVATF